MTRIVDAFRALALLGLVCVALTATTPPAAADINTWTNAANNLNWNTTSVDWNSPTIWNNANVDDAIFGATGAGTITVGAPITLHGIYFTADGYALNGGSALTLAIGGILAAGEIQVGGGSTATINAPIAGSAGHDRWLRSFPSSAP